MTQPRLLIVDDEADFAVSTARALALEGVQTVLAHDGAGAVAAVEAGDCQMALLDIRIRNEDGTELAARLKTIRPDLIVIIMTAYASVDSAISAMQAGAHDYLRKPFFLDELMRALGRGGEILELRHEKEAAERELAMLRQLEATSQLAAGLSHDFLNMLAVVQGNLSVLSDRLGDAPALLPYARDANKAAASAASVVARLGGFLRDRKTDTQPIDLRDPVRAAVEMVRGTICAGMTLRLSLPAEPLLVLADASLVETAIVNLLINARDATQGHGGAVIFLSRIVQGGSYARLSVQDDGPGLDDDAQGRALTPFFTTKTHGTGLGLPMIQQFALNNGGRFHLANSSEGGAIATLDLPALPVHSVGANI
ncbi:response regulator [Paracoccus sp. Z330]|uniref:histidine kinase n=1 Tax=Paracoccus onchidii TaxID=3017813 RepID=A0ABT4ZGC7_9RHOB|nr:response regulator [Paracoccus onchidii]MDB6178421.1 response regulator [Paracoccus onchidii]